MPTTDPTLLKRLKEMLASSARADIAVGYFFMSGFEAVAEDLSKLLKVRILVGRTDQQVLEEVAAGLQQASALRDRLQMDTLVQRRQRAPLAQQAVDHIRDGVSMLPQEQGTEAAVKALRDLVADGKVEVRTYLRSPLHAKAYLYWYDNHAEPGVAVVGSSNLTLTGFEGNTELNVRGSGDAEMAALKEWFDDLWADSVRLIQRFGRVDRIGTEHTEISLHNMWPDVQVDEQLSLTERLTRRIQSVHDLIGLDSKLLSEADRLNLDAMYRIYGQKELSELDDGLDEVAVNQRAVALLQRIHAEDPTLCQTITDLPDGIRSALKVPTKQDEEANYRYVQNPLDVEGAQAPLMSPASLESISSPFDDPGPDETLVLLGAGDVHGCYAVGSDLEPRAISHAQLIAAAECDETTPAQPLPKGTNERVMAAFAAFQSDFQTRLGRSRRRRDTKARRYLSRQLSIALRDAGDDTAETQRIEALRRIFLVTCPSRWRVPSRRSGTCAWRVHRSGRDWKRYASDTASVRPTMRRWHPVRSPKSSASCAPTGWCEGKSEQG